MNKENGEILRGGYRKPDPIPKTIPPASITEEDYGMWACDWTGPKYASTLKAIRAGELKKSFGSDNDDNEDDA